MKTVDRDFFPPAFNIGALVFFVERRGIGRTVDKKCVGIVREITQVAETEKKTVTMYRVKWQTVPAHAYAGPTPRMSGVATPRTWFYNVELESAT